VQTADYLEDAQATAVLSQAAGKALVEHALCEESEAQMLHLVQVTFHAMT
jgi:hypothetical protein